MTLTLDQPSSSSKLVNHVSIYCKIHRPLSPPHLIVNWEFPSLDSPQNSQFARVNELRYSFISVCYVTFIIHTRLFTNNNLVYHRGRKKSLKFPNRREKRGWVRRVWNHDVLLLSLFKVSTFLGSPLILSSWDHLIDTLGALLFSFYLKLSRRM